MTTLKSDTQINSQTDIKTKLDWQCRRGMLELDVVLKPFLDNHFDNLNQSQQQCFINLLKESDPDLYSWLMGYAQSADPEFAAMITLIQQKQGIKQSS